MANKIILKKSSVGGKVPQSSDLEFGELAINYTDGVLYYKSSDNSIESFTGLSGYSGYSGISGFSGISGYSGYTPLGALNWNQTLASQVTVPTSDTFPRAIANVTITTNGNPVQIIASGDANPLGVGWWGTIQLYRGTTAIGGAVNFEASSANENNPYCLQFIDNPGAGTYTYSLKVNQLSGGSTQFGESSGPVISVVELQNVQGESGYSGISGYSGEPGTSGYSGYSGISGWSGISGYSGYSGAIGAPFTIAKVYASYDDLAADTSPTGIETGQYAIIDTGSAEDGDTGKLYVWNGVSYQFIADISGPRGYSGYSGYSGQDGFVGADGASGYSGYSGYSGLDGATGVDGASGYSGYSGYSGLDGASGYSGYSGISGYSGQDGIDGASGYSGISGYSGQNGVDGASGYSGFSGISGYSGYSGQNGSIGVDGASGYSGYSGISGYSGQDGASGYSGYSGYSGEQGPTIYPAAGIPKSTGSAWDTSYSTTGSGDVVLNTYPTLQTGFKLNAVGISGYTPIAETIASIVSDDNQYKVFYLQNKNSGSDASSDFIVYNDQASEDAMSYYIDMGINSSNFSSTSWPIFPANSAYILVAGGDPESPSAQPSHLYLGTGTPDSDIVLFAGGLELTNRKAIIKSDTGNLLLGTINDDGLNKLQVAGGGDFTGSVNVDGAVYLGGAITQASQAATKAYVDNAAATGIHIHDPVRVEKHGSWTVTYTDGGSTLTVTTIASNKTLTTSAAHSLSVNDVVYFTSTTNGLTLNTPYFVYSTPTTDTFTLAAAYLGEEIDTLTNGTSLSITCKANTGVGATLTNAGTQAALNIGGVDLEVGDRVAVIRSADKYQNGIYVVNDIGSGSTNWELERASDNNKYAPHATDGISDGDYFYVQEGSPGAGESYVVTTDTPILFGITDIAFTLFNAAVGYTVLSPLNLTGTTLSLAGVVGETNGGTGQSTVATGDLLYGSGTNTWSKLSIGTAYKSLVVNGTGTELEWNAVALNQNAAVSGQLRLVNGGTGANLSAVNGGVVYSSSSSLAITAAGTSGYILMSTGANAPVWTAASAVQGTSGYSGYSGYSGEAGPQGVSGYSGYSGAQGGGLYTYSATAPATPGVGDRWIDSDDGREYTYINDGDSSQWVETAISFNNSLPSGGTSGYILTKNTSDDFDVSWKAYSKEAIGLGNVENTALSTYVGSAYLATVGNVTAGTWNADTITVSKGGTGQTSLTSGYLIVGNGTSAVTALPYGSSGNVVKSNGSSWTSGTLSYTEVGIPAAGTSGNVLKSNGTTWTSAALTKSEIGLSNVENTALSTWAGTSNITTVGTIATGTWQGTDVGLAYGGTNATLTAAAGGVVYSTASAMAITTAGTSGQFLQSAGTGTPVWSYPNESMTLAVSDETTAITTGTAKITFRMPYAVTLYQLPRVSLSTASTSGNPAIDINVNGSSIFSTTLTIDANEKTSTTAATAAVLSTTSVADDAEITVDIDTAGTGAKGLKVTLYYRRA